MSKASVCRVCLEYLQNDSVSLSEKYHEFVLYEFINSLTNLKIRLSDGYPDQICWSCYLQLKSTIDLKEKCEASDVSLKSNAVKIEISPENKTNSVKRELAESKVKIEDEYEDDTYDCSLDILSEHEVKKEDTNGQDVPPIHTEVDSYARDVTKNEIRPSRAKDLKLICDDCGGSFKSKCKLKVHWKKTHMYDALVCPICKRAFKSFRAFNVHKKKKTQSCATASNENVIIEGVGKGRVFCCKHCKYRSKRAKDMTAHIVIHTGDRPYKCNLCLKTYTQLSSLQGHQEIAHQMYILQMTCHYCGKFVKGRRRVNRHLKSHKQVECPVCHKTVKNLSYKQHLQRHSGSKSYACEKCASTFYTMAELCNHKRFKHVKKAVKCTECDYTCFKAHIMKSHISKHTGKNISCTLCGRFYLSEEKLLMHQRLHYTEKKHGCPHCESKFVKRDSLKKHLKVKHPETLSVMKTTATVVVKTEANGLVQAEVTITE